MDEIHDAEHFTTIEPTFDHLDSFRRIPFCSFHAKGITKARLRLLSTEAFALEAVTRKDETPPKESERTRSL
jgi:hypothetical protein